MLGGVWESNKHGEIYIQLRCLGIPRLLRCLETRNGKILHAEQELDNAVDKFAVKVVKNRNCRPFTVRVLANFDNCTWRKELQTAVRRNGDSL